MMTRGSQVEQRRFEALVARLDELIQEFEALPYPAVREMVFELLQTVDGVHRAGLTRLMNGLRDRGLDLAESPITDDPVVRTLLTLYDLAPAEPISVVEQALEEIRPYLHSHGGEVEVLDVIDGIVHLRMVGSCQGCPASEITLRRRIETALRDGVPGFARIELRDPEPEPAPLPPSDFIPLAQIGPARQIVQRRPVFREVATLDALPAGAMLGVELDGVSVLLANVAGEVYAVRNHCPGSAAPLSLGVFTPPIVVCPWHNEAFDVRTGKRADGEAGAGLGILPVAVRDGAILLAVDTAPVASGWRPA
jgi:nitrite reductase/ring-hydroxylating ferredoxin subunit/Fe-S cluster biogenesis protein NfuA